MKLDDFYVLSVNYKDFELVERESFVRRNPSDILEEYFQKSKIEGYVILETCLRVEIYLDIKAGFSVNELCNEFGFCAQIKKGKDALRYIFNLVCGLESIIKGEDQILSQIRKAYLLQMNNGRTSKSLNNIFNKAIQAGKRFRFESSINTHNLSLDAISVKFIRSKFDDISDKKVFIIGVGELSSQILAILYKSGVKEIAITNRSKHKAETIHMNYKDVKLVDYNEKYTQISKSDIIISATSAPHFIVKESELKDTLFDGKERFFLDLAVPRDIDSQIGEYDKTTLYHLEDIWETYNQNVATRQGIADEYYYVIDDIMDKAVKWFEFSAGI